MNLSNNMYLKLCPIHRSLPVRSLFPIRDTRHCAKSLEEWFVIFHIFCIFASQSRAFLSQLSVTGDESGFFYVRLQRYCFSSIPPLNFPDYSFFKSSYKTQSFKERSPFSGFYRVSLFNQIFNPEILPYSCLMIAHKPTAMRHIFVPASDVS